MLQKFDSSGNAVFSNPVNLTPDAFGDKNVKNIHEIEGVGFVVIFQSESWLTGLTVEYVVVDYDGNLLSESGLLVDDSGENQIYQSSASTNFGVFVSYLKESGSDSDVYAQLISSSGELLGNSSGISIVSRVGKQDNVTTAYNPVLEEVMVCYQDRINDLYYDISCSALDSSLSLSDELIVADLSNVNQVEPFVYSTLDGSYLVVWQDDRNYSGTLAGNEDIYLQQITNGSIVHQQNGIAVCNESYFPQKNPQIELYDETNNSYVIFWNDLRSSCNSNFTNIYAKSITVDFGPACTLGDINQDSVINVIDIVSLVNYILGAANFNDTQLCASDLNGDSVINVIDIVSLVNQILSL